MNPINAVDASGGQSSYIFDLGKDIVTGSRVLTPAAVFSAAWIGVNSGWFFYSTFIRSHVLESQYQANETAADIAMKESEFWKEFMEKNGSLQMSGAEAGQAATNGEMGGEAGATGDPSKFDFDKNGKIKYSDQQLQAKFKHANDFGVKGNYSQANSAKLKSAIDAHVNNPTNRVIQGTFRGKNVVFHVNENTGLTVIKDQAGKFISGWKLNPQQLLNVLTRGSL